jgi:hypothetical protein
MAAPPDLHDRAAFDLALLVDERGQERFLQTDHLRFDYCSAALLLGLRVFRHFRREQQVVRA